jgi:hypothetical protein
MWKSVFSVSMPEKFLPQLPYNERSQIRQGLSNPFKRPSTPSPALALAIRRFVATDPALKDLSFDPKIVYLLA